jgi:hypothetical protein
MASSEDLREAFKAGFIAGRVDAVGDDKAFNIDWEARGLEEGWTDIFLDGRNSCLGRKPRSEIRA